MKLEAAYFLALSSINTFVIIFILSEVTLHDLSVFSYKTYFGVFTHSVFLPSH